VRSHRGRCGADEVILFSSLLRGPGRLRRLLGLLLLEELPEPTRLIRTVGTIRLVPAAR